MKAVVVEIKGHIAAVLSDDGCIEKVKNNNYAIGQVIRMKEKTAIKTSKLKVWAAVAAALVVLIGGTSALAYGTPYSYVSVDVNPSIELSLNMFDRVLSVKAVNDDGAEVLSQIDLNQLNNQNINTAITTIVDEISNEGYFAEGEGGIIVAAASNDQSKADDLAQQLGETVNAAVNGETDPEDPTPTPAESTVPETSEEPGTTLPPVSPEVTPDPNASPDPNATPDPSATPVPAEGEDEDVEVEVIAVGLERVREARELGVTPGKLNLVQKLQATTEDDAKYVTTEWVAKSVQEIQAEIKANRKGLNDEEPDPSEEPTESATPAPDGTAATPAPTTTPVTDQGDDETAEAAEAELEQEREKNSNQGKENNGSKKSSSSGKSAGYAGRKTNGSINKGSSGNSNGKSGGKSNGK
jgi:hypothetical protein